MKRLIVDVQTGTQYIEEVPEPEQVEEVEPIPTLAEEIQDLKERLLIAEQKINEIT